MTLISLYISAVYQPIKCCKDLKSISTGENFAYYQELDSLNACFIGNWPFGGSWTLALDSIHKIAFVGSGGGVSIIDIADPSNPQKLGELRTRGTIWELFHKDGSLYIANHGFEIWDISDPTQPLRLSSIAEPFVTQAVKDSYAYLASDNCFKIINVQNPEQPYEVGSYNTNWSPKDIAVNESYAFVASMYDYGVRIINIQNPTNPYEEGFWDSLSVSGIVVSNSYAYLATRAGLRILDVSNPANPRVVGRLDLPFGAEDLVVSESCAFLAVWNGLRIINILNPSLPFEIGACTTSSTMFKDVVRLDTFAYLSDLSSKHGLWIINIKNYASPFEAGCYSLPGWAFSVALENNYAYLVSWEDGLRILNIENPSYPYEVGSFATEYGAQGVAIRDTLAYLCDFAKGLRILNISDRSRPTELGFCPTPGAACAVAIKGDYAYIADGDYGLRVINIENPTNPYEVGFCDTPGYAWNLAIQDSFAYIADERGGLRIINIQNPAHPYEVGSLLIPDGPVVVVVKDSYAFVGGYEGGNMRIINVGEPANPYEVGFFETYGPCFGISLEYPYAYVSDWFWGFWIAEISEPSNPIRMGYYNTPNSAYGLASRPPYVYVTTGLCGLQIYENLLLSVEEKKISRLAIPEFAIYPNPAKSVIRVRVPLTVEEIKIFDVTGKTVREIALPEPSRNDNEVKISLKGINPGIYFLQLGTETKKFLVVK